LIRTAQLTGTTLFFWRGSPPSCRVSAGTELLQIGLTELLRVLHMTQQVPLIGGIYLIITSRWR